jgi:uncharacterized membrane protein
MLARMNPDRLPQGLRGIPLAGILLGLGLGGFFDGIVFHQLLRWHHLVCSTETCVPATIADYERATFQDGLFHALCWVLTTAGLVRLVTGRPALPSSRPVLAWSIVGWGLFNLVEGTIDHLLLGIHHVRPGPSQLAWDLAFLAWGALFVVGGYLLSRPPHGDNQLPSPETGQRISSSFQTP